MNKLLYYIMDQWGKIYEDSRVVGETIIPITKLEEKAKDGVLYSGRER